MIDMTELEQLSSSQDEIIHIIWYVYIYTCGYLLVGFGLMVLSFHLRLSLRSPATERSNVRQSVLWFQRTTPRNSGFGVLFQRFSVCLGDFLLRYHRTFGRVKSWDVYFLLFQWLFRIITKMLAWSSWIIFMKQIRCILHLKSFIWEGNQLKMIPSSMTSFHGSNRFESCSLGWIQLISEVHRDFLWKKCLLFGCSSISNRDGSMTLRKHSHEEKAAWHLDECLNPVLRVRRFGSWDVVSLYFVVARYCCNQRSLTTWGTSFGSTPTTTTTTATTATTTTKTAWGCREHQRMSLPSNRSWTHFRSGCTHLSSSPGDCRSLLRLQSHLDNSNGFHDFGDWEK